MKFSSLHSCSLVNYQKLIMVSLTLWLCTYVVSDYSCAMQKDILVHGRLYISQSFICFYANIFRWETSVSLRILVVWTDPSREAGGNLWPVPKKNITGLYISNLNLIWNIPDGNGVRACQYPTLGSEYGKHHTWLLVMQGLLGSIYFSL